MWRTIKIWHLIRLLESDCFEIGSDKIERLHTPFIYIKERAFLERAARRVVHPRKSYGACPDCGKNDRDELNRDKKIIKKVAHKMAEYDMLLELCREKGYLDSKEELDKKTNHPVVLIRPSVKASEMMGFMDLIEVLLKQYKLTWTFILIPVATSILGNIYWSKIVYFINNIGV
ncbi:MAG: hypothetical protein WAU28_04890 [Candidatus Moraniibacteriota bacterium]